MGLDMYLRATEYVSRYEYSRETDTIERTENALFKQIVDNFGVADHLDEDGAGGLDVSFPMGYWRKSNQIHNWFVNEIGSGVDECQVMYVSREKLEELKELCIQVIANPEMAEELLPTGSGFFFGSTDYNEWYFMGLNDTIGIINRCLESKFDYFEYQASW